MKNCLKFYPCSKHYYLFHPWEWVEQTFLNLKAARQRATRGYADRDVWDMDDFLLAIMPEMVDKLRENSHGYCAAFENEEKWKEYLNEVSTHLRKAANEEEGEIEIALSMMADYWYDFWD